MKRSILLATVLALVVSACSSGSAAVVNGTTISTAQVADLLTDPAAPDQAAFNDMLYQVIVDQIVSKAAQEQFEISVSDEDIQGGISEIEASLAGQGVTLDVALSENGFSEAVLPMIVRQDRIQTQLTEHFASEVAEPTEEEIQATFDAGSAELTEVCASHILVESEEDAQDIYDRAVAGEDFAAMAIELSTDTVSGAEGGDLGCSSPSGYVAPFAAAVMEAPLNEPFGPVESEFGYHVIVVSERTLPDLSEYHATIATNLKSASASTLLTEWYVNEIRTADVQVAESYGTWTLPEDTTQPPTIVAP